MIFIAIREQGGGLLPRTSSKNPLSYLVMDGMNESFPCSAHLCTLTVSGA